MSMLASSQDVGHKEVRQRATSRLVWWIICALCVGLIFLRLPATLNMMKTRISDRLAGKDVDPALIDLSVNVAGYIGVILYAVVMCIYLGFASFLESKLLPSGLQLAGRHHRVGLFCLLVGTLTVITQIVALVIGALPSGVGKYAYVFTVAAALPWCYRRYWTGRKRGRTILIFTSSFGLAFLVSLF